jgi:lysophospholipase L1-like esterase
VTMIRNAPGAAFGTVLGERLRRAATRAYRNNSVDLPVMTTPPTVTGYTSNNPVIDAALTSNYRFTSGQASSFMFCGGTPTVYSTNYYRFPVVTLTSGTGNALPTQDAKGWAVEFMSDAPKLLLDFLGSSSTIGVQIEVDGQRIAATSTPFVTPATAERWFTVDFTGVRQVRHFRVEGWGSAGMRGVSVGALDKVWPPSKADLIRAAVVGDSITAQQGSGLPNGGFAYHLGKLLGWTDVRAVGLGGTGFINPSTYSSTFGDATRVADVVATNPDVLVIPASSNDAGNTAGAVTAAALATYQAYRAALPKVPIICGGVWGGATGPLSTWIAVETAAQAAFTSWADPNSWFVPVSTDPTGAWVTGTGHLGATNGTGNSDVYVGAADTTHPSEDGHLYLARRYANAIRTQVLPKIAT